MHLLVLSFVPPVSWNTLGSSGCSASTTDGEHDAGKGRALALFVHAIRNCCVSHASTRARRERKTQSRTCAIPGSFKLKKGNSSLFACPVAVSTCPCVRVI